MNILPSLRHSSVIFTTLLGASLFAGPGNVIVVDNFDAGWTTVTVGSAPTTLQSQTGFPHAGNRQFGFTSDEGILGGQRVGIVRDGHSGALSSGLAAIAITDSYASFYGTASAVEQILFYGSAIDRDVDGPGTPVNWGLNLPTASTFDFTIGQIATYTSVPQSLNITFSFHTGAGNVNYQLTGSTVGTYSVSLASMGLSLAQAGSINGLAISINNRGDSAALGTQINNIQFSAAAIPEPSSFASIAGLGACAFAATRRRRK